MIGKLGEESKRQISENIPLTIQVWNQLPADVLETLFSKSSNFRKRLGKLQIRRSERVGETSKMQ
jgi:hypothetical protein